MGICAMRHKQRQPATRVQNGLPLRASLGQVVAELLTDDCRPLFRRIPFIIVHANDIDQDGTVPVGACLDVERSVLTDVEHNRRGCDLFRQSRRPSE